jgi:hypothetical protein
MLFQSYLKIQHGASVKRILQAAFVFVAHVCFWSFNCNGFGAALVAKTNIILNGDTVVDSFNSQNTYYSTGGLYDLSKRRDRGHIYLTERFVSSFVSVGGSVEVFGGIFINAGDTLIINGGGTVGNSNWVANGNTGLQAGAFSTSYEGATLPDEAVPFSIGLPLPSKTTINFQGALYANSYLLNAGNYKHIANLSISSADKILISGDVNLHCVSNFQMFGTSQIIIGTNSSLKMYLSGSGDFSGFGVTNRTQFATNVQIIGLNTCQSLRCSSGRDFCGIIYAPNAAAIISSGGNIAQNFSGALVAGSITVSGKNNFHYDESLSLVSLLGSINSGLLIIKSAANGFPVVWVYGFGGYNYALESSTNLTDWSRVMTNTSPFSFTNIPTDVPQQFYRAVYLP